MAEGYRGEITYLSEYLQHVATWLANNLVDYWQRFLMCKNVLLQKEKLPRCWLCRLHAHPRDYRILSPRELHYNLIPRDRLWRGLATARKMPHVPEARLTECLR